MVGKWSLPVQIQHMFDDLFCFPSLIALLHSKPIPERGEGRGEVKGGGRERREVEGGKEETEKREKTLGLRYNILKSLLTRP